MTYDDRVLRGIVMEKRKRAEISPQDRRLITELALSSNLPREKLARLLKPTVKDSSGRHPQVETLKRLISNVRNKELPFEDHPWQLGVMYDLPIELENSIPRGIKYSIPPEALQIVLTIQKNFDKSLTIREVKWLARIYSILKNQPVPHFIKIDERNSWYYLNCHIWASMYADLEKTAFISGNNQLDTTYLDSALLEDVFSILSKPLDQINEGLAKLFMDYMSKVQMVVSDPYNKILNLQGKIEFNKQFAQVFELGLTGHSFPDISYKDFSDGLWISYANVLRTLITAGFFYKRTQRESEEIINRLRNVLPEMQKASEQSPEIFNQTTLKFLESIKPKEGE